ncbi:MAG: type II toxin-antitoxin system RelE/ParE family toxin, partial [Ruminiclostridium sp.]|nr:type II toxin-antitoxin system RelE/ParE family toxin [Ruminiclostridium sp.]
MIMEEYNVNLTEYAVEQMEEVVEYISKILKEPEIAKKWSLKIQNTIKSLNIMPARFPLVDREPWHSENIHKMTVENFIVYY